jgi:hypothetical protein
MTPHWHGHAPLKYSAKLQGLLIGFSVTYDIRTSHSSERPTFIELGLTKRVDVQQPLHQVSSLSSPKGS